MIYYRILHIRGTPASGKSILRLLLARYINVVRPAWTVSSQEAWPHHLQDNDLNGTAAFVESCLNLPRDQFYSTQDRVLLVDEAHDAQSSWSESRRLCSMRTSAYRLYGPRTTCSTRSGSTSRGRKHVKLSASPRNFTKTNLIAPELLDWLYYLSGGHAGALDSLVQVIRGGMYR